MKSWAMQPDWDFQVLLFEDDPEVAATLSAHLERWACSVTIVSNGIDGVKTLLWSDFDFVVCDLTIPGLSYQALYKAVVRLRPYLCERFIFISGHAADPGVDAFTRRIKALTLWEPFEMYELTSAMRTVLRKAGRGSDYRHSAGLAFALSAEFEVGMRATAATGRGVGSGLGFAHSPT